MSEDLRQDGEPEPDEYKVRDDTEGHRQSAINGRDGEPEGATRKQTLIDTDDDVEGHKKPLGL